MKLESPLGQAVLFAELAHHVTTDDLTFTLYKDGSNWGVTIFRRKGVVVTSSTGPSMTDVLNLTLVKIRAYRKVGYQVAAA